MRKLLLVLCMLLSMNSSIARWDVEVKNDLFSGGKTARLFGEMQRKQIASLIAVDCDSHGKLSLIYSQPNDNNKLAEVTPLIVKMAIKVDRNDVIIAKAQVHKADDGSLEIKTDDKAFIMTLLTQLRIAGSEVILGVDMPAGNISSMGNVKNSTKSINQFVSACNIK